MEAEIQLVDDIPVIVLKGRLQVQTADILREACSRVFANQHNSLILDCRGLDYVSSAGLSVILGAAKEASGRNGKLVLAEAQPSVKEILDLSGFAELFPIVPSLAEAKRLLSHS